MSTRTPLKAKSTNIPSRSRSNSHSPLKRTSPFKINNVSPIKRSRKSSPNKKVMTNASIKTKTDNNLPFTIFQDPETNLTPKVRSITISQFDEENNVDEENKENMNTIPQLQSSSNSRSDDLTASNIVKRRILSDLNILDYPAFIHYDNLNNPLHRKDQLKNSWQVKFNKENKKINVLSYATPPKNRIVNYKFVESLNNNNEDAVIKTRSFAKTTDDIIENPPNKVLNFLVYDDVLDN